MTRMNVAIAGATGKVGRELVKAVLAAPDLALVGATGRSAAGQDAGRFTGGDPAGVTIRATLDEVLAETSVDVLIDFTIADISRNYIRLALGRGIPVVSGTTGFSEADRAEFASLSEQHGAGLALVSNFALGVMLLNRFAEQASRYFPRAEIIEMHHSTKIDAPSGTALRLQERTAAAGGLEPSSIPIHSMRLPGAVAHHEITFGGLGQLLTIRHDSLSRESFVPGVLLAVRRIRECHGMITDLDQLLD